MSFPFVALSLLSNFSGSIYWPSDDEYDVRRTPWEGRFKADSFPSVIIAPSSPEDVIKAMEFAHTKGWEVTPRNGGHSYVGGSTTNGMQLDMAGLTSISVNKNKMTAKIGAGQNILGVYNTLYTHAVAFPGGGCPSVGFSGLVMGGGFGMMSTPWGIASDQVLQATVVVARNATPGGKIQFAIVNASATEHPELFFAIRGGMGGNYGVVCDWTVRVFPATAAYKFAFHVPVNSSAVAIGVFNKWAKDTTKDTTSEILMATDRCPMPIGQTRGVKLQLMSGDAAASCRNKQQPTPVTLGGMCVCEKGNIHFGKGDCSRCIQSVSVLNKELALRLSADSTNWTSHRWDEATEEERIQARAKLKNGKLFLASQRVYR
jgi:FAD/FMN-containing dehydrogenase